MTGQLSQQMVELCDSGPISTVRGHSQTRTFGKNLTRQARQHIARTHLHKNPGARVKHMFDLIDKTDRTYQMIAQKRSRILGGFGIRPPRGIGKNVEARPFKTNRCDERRQQLPSRGNHRRVKGTRYGDGANLHSCFFKAPYSLPHAFLSA